METDQEEAAIKVEEVTIKVENAFEPEEFSLSHIKFEYEPEFGTSVVIKEENELMLDESIYDETNPFTESVDPLEIPETNTNTHNCKEVRRSQRVLSCTRCSAKFTDKKILMRHLIAHIDEEPMETSAVSAFSSLFIQKPKELCKIGRTDTVIKVEGELIEDVNDFISESSLHSATDFVKRHKTGILNNKPIVHKQRKKFSAGPQGNKVNLHALSKDISLSSSKASLVNSDDRLKQSKTYYNSDCIKLKDVSVLLENIGPVVSDKLKVQNKSPINDKLRLNFDSLCSSEPQNQLEENVNSRELSDGSNGKEQWFSCTVCPSKYKLKISFQRHLARHCRAGEYSFAEYLAKVGSNIDPQISIPLDSQLGTSCKTDSSTERSDLYKPEKSKPIGNMKNFQVIRSSRRVLSCAHCAEKFTDKTVLIKHLIAFCGDDSFCDVSSKSVPKNLLKSPLNSNGTSVDCGGNSLCDDVSSKSVPENLLKSPLNSNETSVDCGDNSLCDDVSSKSVPENLLKSPLNFNETSVDCGDNSLCDDISLKSAPKNLLKSPLNSNETSVYCGDNSPCNDVSSKSKLINLSESPLNSNENSSCDNALSKSKPNNLVKNPLNSNKNVLLQHSECPSDSPQINPFKCPVCHRYFKKKCGLKNHFILHPDEKIWPCPHCPFNFVAIDAFLSHLTEKHTFCRTFSCSYCPEKFKQINKLKLHEVIHTDVTRFVCTECPASFKRKGDLSVHLRKHFGEAKFKCTLCPFQFYRRNDFNKHIRSHSNEKMYVCPHCPKRYKEKYHLQSHISVHSVGRRFSCSECPLKFKSKDRLKKHLFNKHGDSRLFGCSLCSKKFSNSNRLKSHLMTHSTQRFLCAHCTSSFRYKPDLKKHLQKVHSFSKQITCSFCSKIFVGASKLKRHLEKSHADNLNAPLENP